MTRTTTPDRYSRDVHGAYLALRAGRIGRKTFAALVNIVWSLRRGT
jgi:hypothetical protein